MPVRRVLAALCLVVLAGCSGSGSSTSPFVVGPTPTASPGRGAQASLGGGVAGDLHVTQAGYTLVGGKVRCLMVIANSGAVADRLVAATSNVGATATIAPDPMPVPAHGSITINGTTRSVTLPVSGRLDPGSTVALTLTFTHAGSIHLFLSPKP